jgi:signal transduction histidine kinase
MSTFLRDTLSILDSLKMMDLQQIESEHKTINNLLFQFIKSNEFIIPDLMLTIINEINRIISINCKYYDLEIIDNLFKDLKEYYTYIYVNSEYKIEFLKELSNKFVYTYFTNFPEIEILKPININIIEELKKVISPYQRQFIILIELVLEIELRYIGQLIKNLISKKLTRKENSIVENTMHILISSSSDRLGNLVNTIDDKFWYLSNYTNEEDIKTDIRTIEKPMNDLKSYLDNQSKLFKSFKNEINKMTPDEFYFMLDFIFYNGFKIKYPKIKISISKELKNIKYFCVNEYLIVNSMYALIENSIEANANIVEILIKNSDNEIYIEIKDNGKELPEKIQKYIFDKNFSFNKPGHFGLGLYIAKNWLESVSCKIDYVKENKIMRVIIPIGNRLYE